VNRAAAVVLVLVTLLDLGWGRASWSWLAGPIAALVVLGLDHAARKPSAPAPKHRREPAPVD
jgi:hypothetical protein